MRQYNGHAAMVHTRTQFTLYITTTNRFVDRDDALLIQPKKVN